LGKTLTLAVADPFDVLMLDNVKIVTGCEIIPVVSTDISVRKAIDQSYKNDQKTMDDLFQGEDMSQTQLIEEKEDLEATNLDELKSETSPVVKMVNVLIMQAIDRKASDIHIEPFEKKLRVRYRVDGACAEVASPPKRLHPAITSRIKIMAGMDIAERRKPQDGKFQMKVKGRKVDFRVSILPMVHGEKTCIRILDSSGLALSLDDLGFETQALEDFRWAVNQAYGMVLVTGPTGSGKSTTLYSAVREVLRVEDNITTVEDPVEYELEGVNQVPISDKRGLSFAAALRSILRQDPDTIMIGEIRDTETAEIAVKAALTGHLVFSTLHTNDAPGTVTRMIDMGIEPFNVASSVRLVSAQRLLRSLCKECKVPAQPSEAHLARLGMTEEEIAKSEFKQAKGCPRCSSGYKGRFAILETMRLTDDITRIVIDGGSALDIRNKALELGMITLRRCALLNAMRGRTSIDEVMLMTLDEK
jgi:type IV pilus assembly protein PilB